MAIIIRLDVELARRKMRLKELSERTGISVPNLSILKNGRAKALRFSTLNAICTALDTTPGALVEFEPDADDDAVAGASGQLSGHPG